MRHKLFFILFYLEAYPTQDVMGHFFGLNQPQVRARVGQLLPLLQTLLHGELPARHGRDLAAVLPHWPEVNEVLTDGTEHPIARPQHKGRRDRHYSGRRKRPTVKNVIVTAGRRVLLLTPPAPGRCHDKAAADRARLRLRAATRVLGGSGCGCAAHVWTPHKNLCGRALPWQHRRRNQKLARARVPVKRALASVKRLGMLRQPLRARRAGTVDAVRLVGSGLHNFRRDQITTATN